MILTASHQTHLTQSAISPEVIEARGYRSVTQSKELLVLGFNQWQAQNALPGLLIPSVDATGTTHYQFRPDKPKKDRPKYETPAGKGTYGLDIPASVREQVLNSNDELWITEGCKKADAAVSVGLCCVSLPGVWMFTGSDKKPLADWNLIPLQGRSVVVCYDSDAMTKPSVYAALRRFANLLKKHGAAVRFCYLPDDGYTKVGLDDYLATGHTLDQLSSLIREKLEPVATEPVQALLAALNRRCKGKATFTPKVCHIAAGEANEGILSVLRAVADETGKLQDEAHYFAGDAYNRLELPHGSKLAILDDVIGAWKFQIRDWGVVCRAFSGEREYFRHAAPYWFLKEIASLPENAQDELLTEYLQLNLKREQVRERIAQEYRPKKTGTDTDGGIPSEPGSLPPAVTKSQALHALFSCMTAEDNSALEQYRKEFGETAVNIVINSLLPSVLHTLIEKIPAEFHAEYRAEQDAFYSSLCIEESSSNSDPITIKSEQFDAPDMVGVETNVEDVPALELVSTSPNQPVEPMPVEDEEQGKNCAGTIFDEGFEIETSENGDTDTLRAQVRDAWKEADLTASPPLLTRLLQRNIASAKIALETATVPELHILLDYGRSGKKPPHMRC
jgi:hypothetical protein